MFSVPTLSIGDVGVVIRPMIGFGALREVTAAIAGIRGIDRVVIDQVAKDATHLIAHADRPVALAGEIRAALRQRVRSCTVVDGQIVVDLETATSPPATDDRRTTASSPSLSEALPSDHSAMEAINDLGDFSILMFDMRQRYTACAGAFHKRFGHQFALMRGRPAADVVSAEVWPQLQPGYDGALAGRSQTIDFQVPHRDGVFEASFRPLRDGTTIIGGMVIARDVTEQRRATRLLTELSAVLRVTFDESPIAYGLLAPNGRWARVNPALCTLLGCTELVLVSEGWRDRTHPQDGAFEDEAFDEIAAGRRANYNLVKRLRHSDGSWITVRADVSAILDRDRVLLGLIATVAPVPAGSEHERPTTPRV